MIERQPGKTYLAECYWAGVSAADLEALDVRARRSASMTLDGGEQVSYVGSLLMPDDEVVLCFFEAASLESVRSVAERAEIPFARIVESIRPDRGVVSFVAAQSRRLRDPAEATSEEGLQP